MQKINNSIILTVSLLALSSLSLSNCSVGMALSGNKDPDVNVVQKGVQRFEVEMQLGRPIQSKVVDGKTVAIYEYEIGNTQSPGRAAGHAVMDVLTLGLWELAGTPIEACDGQKYEMSIEYDQDHKVINAVTRKI